jgi:hypothetical protein
MAFDKIVGVDGTTYQFPTLVRTRIADNIKQVGSVENLATIDALGPALALKSNTTHNHTLGSLTSNGIDELGDVEIGVVGSNGIALADKHTLQYEASTTKWRNKVASGGVTVSDSRPLTPISGDAWFDSNDGTLYVFYVDGDTSQWVQVQANSALEGTILARLGALEGRATALEADFPVSIANGGTGQTTLSGAQSALGVSTFIGSSFGASGSNGYARQHNGLIFQWGATGAVNASTSVTFTFPITFPNAILSVQGIVSASASFGNKGTSVDSFSTSSVTLAHDIGATTLIRVFAIGY